MESRSHFAKFLTTDILLLFDFSIVYLGSLIQNTFICSIFVNNIYDTTSIILSSLSWTKDEILKTLQQLKCHFGLILEMFYSFVTLVHMIRRTVTRFALSIQSMWSLPGPSCIKGG